MNHWSPSLSELIHPFREPSSWRLSLERYGKGIDNAHVDVLLSPSLRGLLRDTVRKLLLEDLGAFAASRRTPGRLVSDREWEEFRDGYVALFEDALTRGREDGSLELPALFQLAVLKALLQAVVEQSLRLQDELKGAADSNGARESGHSLDFQGSLVVLTRDEHAINRRVLQLLFRHLRELEDSHLKQLRQRIPGNEWPLPEAALFNPVLMVPDLGQVRNLAQDYPVALLADNGHSDWLFQTNQCISKVFQHYLPAWTQIPTQGSSGGRANAPPQERLDQGHLRGFVETEILLRRFVSADEYLHGRCSWLDEPENLRLFLRSGDAPPESASGERFRHRHSNWGDSRWDDFQRAVTAELYRCLDMHGLTRPVTMLYRLASIRTPLGRPIPLSPVLDYVDGRISRRRLVKSLERMRIGMDHASISRMLDRAEVDAKRPQVGEHAPYLDRYLVDFLTLRRDLKLAYKAYETMDGIRLIDEPGEVRLSRSNGSLIELDRRDAPDSSPRRITGHTVIKADLRGSTLITEQLRARDLNPASHFSLNFFDPVNRLLPEFGAEKVFVEGDAVILAVFEYEDDEAGLSVARASGLSRKILQVVALQNVLNRKHGLPELELGLGVAYSREEPNFLYDEDHRIMISGAINRADRLSACDSGLRRGGFLPENKAFRVTVVSDARAADRATIGDDLLRFNVNGVKIEEAAFFKLQRELHLRQVRLPADEEDDTLYFAGFFPDLVGRSHCLVLRYGPVRTWDGQNLGEVDPQRRHFFEVIVDEGLTAQVRRLASPGKM